MEPPPPPAPSRGVVLAAGALAVLASGVLYALFGDVNVNLADEGYLWYGVLRVLEGQVPFRDFQAYDPGRYYWTAAFSPIVGSGLLGVRASASAFQALGLFAGLLAAARLVTGRGRWGWLPLFALVLALSMYPRHKLYEPAIALVVCYALVRLLERPTPRAHLVGGAVVGLVAWFGRNHGLYAGLAFLVAQAFLRWKVPEAGALRRLGLWCAGVAIGYAPMWIMLVVVPGFAGSFFEELLALGEKGTNVPHPWPWPWRETYAGLGGLELVAALAQTALFLVPPVLLPVGLVVAARTRGADVAGRAVLLAGTCAGLFYVHHASVRSDAPHLAQCVQPLLLVLLALPGALGASAAARAGTWVGTAVLIVLVALSSHTSLRWVAPWREASPLVEQEVAGESMRLMRSQAAYLRRLEQTLDGLLAPEDEILIAPSRPMLYCLLGRRAPVRSIYFLWQASDAAQDELVAALEERRVRWVLVVDTAVDDREELRFPRTHRRVLEHLSRSYARVPTPGLPPNHYLFRRSEG